MKNKLEEFIKEIENLKLEEAPDYQHLQGILDECITKMQLVVSPVKQPTKKTKLVIDTQNSFKGKLKI